MNTIGDPLVRQSLIERLKQLTPNSKRRWGTLTPHEMLCHLGDATEMVLLIRPRDQPVPLRSRPMIKLLALWNPMRWPHGWRTNPAHDPRDRGTRPTVFDADMNRAIAAIEGLASAADRTALEPAHGLFGVMSLADWQRWAFKHTDHHLRQFGL